MLIQVLNGLVYGGLLYIVAAGLVLVFGLRRVVNFAHGSLFMVGAYVGFTAGALGNFWLAIVAVVVVLAVMGAALDFFVFRPLQHQDHLTTVLVTFGLMLVLEDASKAIWGSEYRSMPVPDMLSSSVLIAGQDFPVYRLAVIGIAALIAIMLTLWLRFSRIGLYVRASSADPVMTAVQGVNSNAVSIIVVSLGAALAGLSGLIAAPLLAMSPSMGSAILIQSFVIVVAGGLGSLSGAFIAALVIGQTYGFSVVYLPWAATMIPFLLMVAVLLWRPGGLSGGRVHV